MGAEQVNPVVGAQDFCQTCSSITLWAYVLLFTSVPTFENVASCQPRLRLRLELGPSLSSPVLSLQHFVSLASSCCGFSPGNPCTSAFAPLKLKRSVFLEPAPSKNKRDANVARVA